MAIYIERFDNYPGLQGEAVDDIRYRMWNILSDFDGQYSLIPYADDTLQLIYLSPGGGTYSISIDCEFVYDSGAPEAIRSWLQYKLDEAERIWGQA